MKKEELSKKKKKGFTLVEILVVVLILSIIAAIALPQYKKAVLKSKTGQIMSLVRALATAQEEYYAANNTYASSFESLSVSIPSEERSRTNEKYKQHGEWEIVMYCPSGPCESIEASYGAANTDYIVKIAHYLIKKRGTNKFRNAGNLICIAGREAKTKKQGSEICKSLGGTLIDASNDRYFKLPF